MKIDIFNHVFPKSFFDRYIVSGAAGKEIGKRMANATIGFDLDQRFRILDEFQDVRQVITLGQPPIEALEDRRSLQRSRARPTTAWRSSLRSIPIGSSRLPRRCL